jgi:hypothetical protein
MRKLIFFVLGLYSAASMFWDCVAFVPLRFFWFAHVTDHMTRSSIVHDFTCSKLVLRICDPNHIFVFQIGGH